MGMIFAGALIASVIGMPLLTLLCVTTSRGKQRKYLLFWIAAFLGVLGGMVVSSLVLGWFGLAWRSWFINTLGIILMGSGIGMLIQTVNCYAELLEEERATQAWKDIALPLAGGSCALVVLAVLVLGGFVIALNAQGERVVTWEGRKTVEAEFSWHHRSFTYYAYHGPLVQGNEPLGYSTKPVE